MRIVSMVRVPRGRSVIDSPGLCDTDLAKTTLSKNKANNNQNSNKRGGSDWKVAGFPMILVPAYSLLKQRATSASTS